MKQRFIVAVALLGFLLIGTGGIGRETMPRPVIRFIDFYKAAEQAEHPPSMIERIALGLTLAASDQACDQPGI